MKKLVRIVGDVHGKIPEYVNKVKDVSHSVQIGDMGFNYYELSALDPANHRFFGGNHENYYIYNDVSHCLGDFGTTTVGDLEFTFIRGEFSIDKASRVKHEDMSMGKIWWKEEELTFDQRKSAYNMYTKAQPKIMLSHGCPNEIALKIGKPSSLRYFGFDPNTFTTDTQTLLQKCFDTHKPDVWIFGHFHMSKDFVYKGTRFICLNELEYKDFKNGEFS